MFGYSTLLYPDYLETKSHELSDEIIIPYEYFMSIIDEYNNESVLYINIINRNNNMKYMATIGHPHNEDDNIIYVPQWILDCIGYQNDSNCLELEIVHHIDIPIATKIYIKPLDSHAFNTDLISSFSNAFFNLHSIQQNITLPVEIYDNYMYFNIFAYIDKVEPAPISRIVSGEVQVEFINDIENDKKELSYEERRQEVINSWIKRFQNNAK